MKEMPEYYGVELNYGQAVVGILVVVGWGIIMLLAARKRNWISFCFSTLVYLKSHGFVGGRGHRIRGKNCAPRIIKNPNFHPSKPLLHLW